MSDGSAGRAALDLESYLHEHIPISAAMGVAVLAASGDGVRLRAPLDLNINHRSTVFGGSAAAVAILAGWALLHVRLGHASRGDRIVIQHSDVDYVRPLDDDFEAVALPPAADDWRRFQRTLTRRGLARIALTVDLRCRGESAGRCVGTYVVLPQPAEPQAGPDA